MIPYGSIILIDGNEYIAEDCGGAVKNNVIDVWVRHKSNSFGVKYTKVYIKEE
nr:MAG TPA: lytic transglycosylase [Caudoviricetes sp.]